MYSLTFFLILQQRQRVQHAECAPSVHTLQQEVRKKVNMVLKTPTEPIRLIRGGENGGGGMEVGGRGRLHTYRYTVTTRMTPALRWAAMRAISMFHSL